MLRLLQFLIVGHVHKWIEFDRQGLIRSKDKSDIGVASFCRCEKCGVRRLFRMVI